MYTVMKEEDLGLIWSNMHIIKLDIIYILVRLFQMV